MTVGFEVFNDGNSLLVNQDYSNFILSQKLTLTTTNTGKAVPPFRGSHLTVTAPAVAFVAVSADQVVCLESVFTSGNGKNYTFRFPYSPAGTVISVFVFTLIQPNSLGWGFEIYREDGSIAFSGLERYMRVMASDYAEDYGSRIGKSYPIPLGRTAAIVLGTPCGSWEVLSQESGGSGWSTDISRFNMGVRVSGAAYYVTEDMTYSNSSRSSSPPTNGVLASDAMTIVVVDVTNY